METYSQKYTHEVVIAVMISVSVIIVVHIALRGETTLYDFFLPSLIIKSKNIESGR